MFCQSHSSFFVFHPNDREVDKFSEDDAIVMFCHCVNLVVNDCRILL